VRPGSGLKNWLKKEKETAIRFLLNVFHAFASNNVVNHSKTFKRYFQHKKKNFQKLSKGTSIISKNEVVSKPQSFSNFKKPVYTSSKNFKKPVKKNLFEI